MSFTRAMAYKQEQCNASHTIKSSLWALPVETTFGVQTRYDDIQLGLFRTAQRQIFSAVRTDEVQEASAGLYVQQTVRWTNWMRTITWPPSASLKIASERLWVTSDPLPA